MSIISAASCVPWAGLLRNPNAEPSSETKRPSSVGSNRIGRASKKASRLKATLVFLDESAALMAPLLRRTWSRRGETPSLKQRTRSHTKVTIAGALCVPPDRDRVQFYFQLLPNQNTNTERTIAFLGQLQRHIASPIVLIWDRLQAHRAGKVQNFIQTRTRIRTEFLPPYAPELNPVEYVWSYLKTNPLANRPLFDLDSLTSTTLRSSCSVQRTPQLLRSFVKHSPLFLRLK